MARPIKNNADYFSHDTNMRNDRKIKALFAKFWLQWYAIRCLFLEILWWSEWLQLTIGDEIEFEFLAGDMYCETEFLKNVLDYMIKINLIQNEWKKYRCEKLIERLKPLFDKRARIKSKVVSDTETPVYGAKTTQSKVKKSKVKESKVDYIKEEIPKEEKTTTQSWQKTEFILKLNNAKKLWKTYINSREKITWKKTILQDLEYVQLAEIMKEVSHDEFEKILKKYSKICQFIENKQKYIYSWYWNFALYTLPEFLRKIDLMMMSEKNILSKIQLQDWEWKLLKQRTANNSKVLAPKKVDTQEKQWSPPVPEKKLTEAEQKENKEKFNFIKRCVFKANLKQQKATELRKEAKEKNIDPFDLADDFIKNSQKNI